MIVVAAARREDHRRKKKETYTPETESKPPRRNHCYRVADRHRCVAAGCHHCVVAGKPQKIKEETHCSTIDACIEESPEEEKEGGITAVASHCTLPPLPPLTAICRGIASLSLLSLADHCSGNPPTPDVAALKVTFSVDDAAKLTEEKKVTETTTAPPPQPTSAVNGAPPQGFSSSSKRVQRLAAERETAYAPFVPQVVSELDGYDKTLAQRALLESRRQEVLLLDNEIVFNEAIIKEREQGI